MTSAINKMGDLAIGLAGVAVFGYLYDKISPTCDRRVHEREDRNATLLLWNPPRPSEDPRIHLRYREQANEALVWLEKNMSQPEYEFFKNKFVEYLKANILPDSVESQDGQLATSRASVSAVSRKFFLSFAKWLQEWTLLQGMVVHTVCWALLENSPLHVYFLAGVCVGIGTILLGRGIEKLLN